MLYREKRLGRGKHLAPKHVDAILVNVAIIPGLTARRMRTSSRGKIEYDDKKNRGGEKKRQ